MGLPITTLPVVSAAKARLYGYLALAVIAALVIALLGGVWLGSEWRKGREAIDDVGAFKAAVKEATKALDEQRRAYAVAADDAAKSQRRMAAIAERFELNQQEQESHATQTRNELAALVHARPDLAAVRVGDDILCNWNRAAAGADTRRGAGAAAAAALPGCKPVAAVPGTNAGRRRQPAVAPGKPRAGSGTSGALPRQSAIAR